ncbi:MAG: ATP-binding cassette domain-containing protein [Burkholderiales bacterium]|nr:ATP-binding cassette domain-containing protein [Phycisphaerae bacterium]
MIRLKDTIFGYSGRAIVRAGEISLAAGQCLGVFGPNGAGKTTLAAGMIGLIKPLAGQVIRSSELRIGYLPQHRALERHWPMSALDAAAIAATARRRLGWMGDARPSIQAAMTELGVLEFHARTFVSLSGGQQQRVLLAGVLASNPNVLVLDEPTDGLDSASREKLLVVLRARMQAGLAVVLISHNVADLLELADLIAHVAPGATPAEASTVNLIEPGRFMRHVTAMRGRE